MRFPPPKIIRDSKAGPILGMEMLKQKYYLKEIELKKPVNEEMLGRELQRLALFILNDVRKTLYCFIFYLSLNLYQSILKHVHFLIKKI